MAVDVPRETQLLRLLKRDDSNEAEANAILDAQASREDRLAIADNVIDNTGSVENTYKQINELHATLLSEAKR